MKDDSSNNLGLGLSLLYMGIWIVMDGVEIMIYTNGFEHNFSGINSSICLTAYRLLVNLLETVNLSVSRLTMLLQQGNIANQHK